MLIYLFVLCLVPPILIALLLLLRKGHSNKVITAVLFATLIHEVCLVTYPVLHSIVTDFSFEKLMAISISTNDLIKVMLGESIYVLMFCLVLMFGLGMTKSGRKNENNVSCNSVTIPKTEYNVLRFLIILGGFLFATQLIVIGTGIKNNVVKQFYDLMTGAFFSITPIIASAILITKKRSFRKYPLLSTFALICLISLVLNGLLLGLRGRIMWVVSFIAIAGYFNSRRKYLFISVLLLVAFMPLFSFLGGQQFRSMVAETLNMPGGGTFNLIKLFIEQRKATVIDNNQNMTFLDSLAQRAQGPRNSVVLYKLFEKGASANPSVYLGSALFPVPRYFWPEKPIPGSLDDNPENSAIYKVVDIGYNLPYMGSLLASAHAYWEGGWIAVILYGFLTGLLWLWIFVFCSKLPEHLAWIIALSFLSSLLIDGFLTALYPLYTYILIAWKYVMPTLVLYGALKFFKSGSYLRRM
jgi:hypothetical protein